MTRLAYDDARLQEFEAWGRELGAADLAKLPPGYPLRSMIQGVCDIAIPRCVDELKRLRAARESDRSTARLLAEAVAGLPDDEVPMGLADALAAWRAARADVDAMRAKMHKGENGT